MRPSSSDYAAYYGTYIGKVEFDNPLEALEKYLTEVEKFFINLDENISSKPYAEGKWTYKETFGHMMDTERVMVYRALCIARGETKSLPGFEQDDYVRNGNFNLRKISDLNEEHTILRKSTIKLFKTFTEKELQNRGVANNNPVTVLALGFIIAGHDKHHLDVLKSHFQRA